MWKTMLTAGFASLFFAAAPAFAQPVTETTVPFMPGTGGGYAGALTGPGTIGGNGDRIMMSPGTNGSWPVGPSGLGSLTGSTFTATGSLNGLTGGYPVTPRGLAVLRGVNPG
jgi:hypothetical protein